MFVSEYFCMYSPYVRPTSIFLDFCLWEHFKPIVHWAPNENEETLHQLNSYACQTFATTPTPKKGRDFPRPDASKRAVVKAENTLSICCELWLHEHFQHLMRIVTSWTLWAFVANCDFMNTLSICCELWLHEHWAFVANCDFMNKNISAVTKLGTRILTLCCQKKVKYYMIQVCSVECNVLVQLQNLTFTTSVYLNVFFVLMSWTRSWSFFMHFRQNFVRTWVYKPISLCFSVPKINYLFLLKETLLKSWHPISHHTH